jgi:hypothetical protein
MGQLVGLQMTLGNEKLVAALALKGTLTGMSTHMRL